MSINLEKPETVLGKVDAAANFVAQIRLATMIGDSAKVTSAIAEAERLLHTATCQIEEEESDVDKFTKHVGGKTFKESADVLLRTKQQDGDKIEEMFSKIKDQARELQSVKKVSEGRRVACLHAKEMIELLADKKTPDITRYFALIQTLEACSHE